MHNLRQKKDPTNLKRQNWGKSQKVQMIRIMDKDRDRNLKCIEYVTMNIWENKSTDRKIEYHFSELLKEYLSGKML